MVFPNNQELKSGSTQKNSFHGFSGIDYAADLKFTILIDRFFTPELSLSFIYELKVFFQHL